MAIDSGDPATTGRPMTCERLSGERLSSERLSSEAVRALYEVHGRDLLMFLAGVLRNPDSAQDVCQVTFQKLLEVGHEARTETIRGWLFKVAFHEAMAYRRTRSRQQQLEQQSDGLEEIEQSESPVQSLVQAEDVARLKLLVSELPLEQQVVVQQRMLENKTFACIASELNLPLGTVLTRMRLAMQKLQRVFQQDNHD